MSFSYISKVLTIIVITCAAQITIAAEQWECRSFQDFFSGSEKFSPCFYLGAGLGVSRFDPDTSGSNWSKIDDSDNGYKLYTGYHFTKSWFAELHYADLGKAIFKNVNPNLGEQSIDYNVFALYAGYYLPLGLPINTYIKAGLAVVDNKSSSQFLQVDKGSSAQPAAGLGVEYPFAASWMLRAEIETFDLNAHFANISIAYWFGKTRHYQAAKEKPVALEAAVVEEAPSVKNMIVVPVLEVIMLTDNDQDGIYSDKDICPDTPLGITVNDVGCAVFQGKLEGIHFDSDSSELRVSIYGYLDKAVNALKQYDLIKIEIQAYTDSQGDASYNLELSNRRAESVMYYMIDKGIDASRLIATGYGEENPIASNKNPTGRAKNRRVEFKVIQ